MKDRIKQLRQDLGLSQTAFGEKIGVKKNTVSSYETGQNVPMDVIIKAICKEYGVSEKWLRDGEGEMFRPDGPGDALLSFVEELLTKEPQGYKARLLTTLATLTPAEWEVVHKIALGIVGDRKARMDEREEDEWLGLVPLRELLENGQLSKEEFEDIRQTRIEQRQAAQGVSTDTSTIKRGTG